MRTVPQISLETPSPPRLVLVFDVFETGVELDAVDDFFSVAKGLVSDPSGVENVINIVLDAVFAAVVVGVSVVLYNVDPVTWRTLTT